MTNICVIGLLGFFSWEDIRNRELTIFVMCMFGIVGVLLHMLFPTRTVYNLLGGMVVGITVIGISKLTKGSVGMGDGMLLAITGIFLGWESNFKLFVIALILAGVWGSGILVLQKKSRKHRFPFVPFLFASYIVILITSSI